MQQTASTILHRSERSEGEACSTTSAAIDPRRKIPCAFRAIDVWLMRFILFNEIGIAVFVRL